MLPKLFSFVTDYEASYSTCPWKALLAWSNICKWGKEVGTKASEETFQSGGLVSSVCPKNISKHKRSSLFCRHVGYEEMLTLPFFLFS